MGVVFKNDIIFQRNCNYNSHSRPTEVFNLILKKEKKKKVQIKHKKIWDMDVRGDALDTEYT